jgi:hypothetical protein
MIQTLNFTTFANTFQNSSRKEQFSYHALELIFDYIEEYESETGEQIEFDMIGICCEWAESTPAEIIRDYSLSDKIPQFEEHGVDSFTDAEVSQLVHEYLWDETQVAGITSAGTIVYVQF